MAIIIVPVSGANGLVIEIPLEIVNNDQVEEAVVVNVNPRSRNRPERAVFRIRLVETGLGRDISESPVPVVVIERVAIDAGDEDVFKPIVVVVSDGNARVVARSSQSCLLRDVGEVSLAIILEKAVVVLRRIFLLRLQIGTVREENVELAVIVVIENGNASFHGFGRVMLGTFVAVEFE